MRGFDPGSPTAERAVDERHQGGRIQAAGEACSDRYVAPEVEVHRIFKELPERGGKASVRTGFRIQCGIERNLPEGCALCNPILADDHVVRRKQLAHALKHRPVGVIREAPCEECRDHLLVGAPADIGVRTERLDLGGKEERIACFSVIERFYPQAVPGAEEFASPPVPEGERPHSVEPG